MALAHQAFPLYSFCIEIHQTPTFSHTSSVVHIDLPSLINKVTKDKLAMERYKPKKHNSPVKAIRENCIECMGGQESEGYIKRIVECVSSDCALFDFRFGKNPYHTQNLTDEQRKERADRLKLARSHDKRKAKVA